jgi:hypothetical protein
LLHQKLLYVGGCRLQKKFSDFVVASRKAGLDFGCQLCKRNLNDFDLFIDEVLPNGLCEMLFKNLWVCFVRRLSDVYVHLSISEVPTSPQFIQKYVETFSILFLFKKLG